MLGFLRADMAVNALQFQLTRMQFVTEWDRLLRRVILVAGSGPNCPQPHHYGDRDDQTYEYSQSSLISVLHNWDCTLLNADRENFLQCFGPGKICDALGCHFLYIQGPWDAAEADWALLFCRQ